MDAATYSLTEGQRESYRKFAGLALPRHTSYPIASVWRTDFGCSDYRDCLRRLGHAGRDLSVYLHIPFCERLCFYCACNKEIVSPKKRSESDPSESFLAGLEVEAHRVSELLADNAVRQVHLGGGSPTFLRSDHLVRLWGILQDAFRVADDAEIAVEVDPRITTLEQLQTLRQLGFNRISLGVQDFAAHVQAAVNRIQPYEMVEQTVRWCRSLGYSSINFDLIYGLPFQSPQSMSETIEKVVMLAPDRIAFYRLAVIPEIFKWQNTFKYKDLPAGEACLELNLLAINRFLAAGYEFIGLDHFAKPDESLATAVRDGSLRRSFQGMTTGKELDVIGLGPSAISLLDDAFAQNEKATVAWQQALTTDVATERGLHLSQDDRIRRELMQQLYGHGAIDKHALERAFGVSFPSYFADECIRLQDLEQAGLVTHTEDAVRLTTPLGRLLVRVVAAVFDRYLPPDAYKHGMPVEAYSKVG